MKMEKERMHADVSKNEEDEIEDLRIKEEEE